MIDGSLGFKKITSAWFVKRDYSLNVITHTGKWCLNCFVEILNKSQQANQYCWYLRIALIEISRCKLYTERPLNLRERKNNLLYTGMPGNSSLKSREKQFRLINFPSAKNLLVYASTSYSGLGHQPRRVFSSILFFYTPRNHIIYIYIYNICVSSEKRVGRHTPRSPNAREEHYKNGFPAGNFNSEDHVVDLIFFFRPRYFLYTRCTGHL